MEIVSNRGRRRKTALEQANIQAAVVDSMRRVALEDMGLLYGPLRDVDDAVRGILGCRCNRSDCRFSSEPDYSRGPMVVLQVALDKLLKVATRASGSLMTYRIESHAPAPAPDNSNLVSLADFRRAQGK